MRRLTDAESDDAAEWFAIAQRYARNWSRREPRLADAIDDAAAIAAMRVALNPRRSPTALYLTLQSEVRSVLRSEGRQRRRLESLWGRLSREVEPIDDDGPTAALDVLGRLPRRQAEAIRRCVAGDETISEAAREMGTCPANVHKFRRLGLARIRTFLLESA